jgi:GDPmannose 4,6-dehydratase
MSNKKALITGITGMDGSHLAELLLEKGYEVHGIIRRTSTFNTDRIDHIFDKLKLHYGDVTDPLVISNLVSQIQPDEIYNLAAQSHVKVSFEIPYYTAQVDGLGTLAILEAVKNHCPKARVYQASTSELYGGMGYNMPETGYTETSPMHPRSPYGVAKLYGLWITKNYRESYGMHISNGILFNHEGERRGETFVTRKITIGLSKIKKSLLNKEDFESLKLGNLYSKRDWGYAKDYVEGMWRMLQMDKPDDYVLATNETHSIKEFIDLAVDYIGIDTEWVGEGINEKLVTKSSGKVIIEIDEKYYRPAEVDILLGDYSKAKEVLGWQPVVTFENLVKIMINNDEELFS